MKKSIVFFVLALTILSGQAFAGGYQVRLQGNKQTGMGLIGAPLRFDLSGMYYNPGAFSFMKSKFGVEAGGSFIFANVAYQADNSTYLSRTHNSVGTPFYLYAGGKLTKNLSLGLAIYTPYGSAVKWNNDWALKFLIQNISLKAIYYQPTLSFSIGKKLGIGVGYIYATGDVNMSKALNYGNNSGVNLKGTTHNSGFSIGVQYRPTEKLTIGATYRSKIMMNVKNGTATFTVPGSLSTMIPASNAFNASLPLPATLDLGVSYRIKEKWLLAAELDWVYWGVYDTLTFTFEKNPQMLNNKNPRLYKNTVTPRIGVQYTCSKSVTLRAGMFVETTPTNKDYFSPETPSLNTFAYTLGVSYHPTNQLSIDFSFIQLFGKQSKMSYSPANVSGTYKSNTVVPGIGISYHF